jgi:hypothetical protein
MKVYAAGWTATPVKGPFCEKLLELSRSGHWGEVATYEEVGVIRDLCVEALRAEGSQRLDGNGTR